jgi:dihydrofolate synthase/folylpolyglutamate synthase
VVKDKKITSVTEAFSYLLENIPNFGKWKISPTERTYRLARMEFLLNHFENPHLAYKTFHVAGTKGKGSTATFLASVLDAAGYKTGLYTSPHVSDPGERILVAMTPIEDRILIELVNQMRNVVESIPSASLPGSFQLTPFELLTVLAFLYFRVTKCHFAIIETGIGGRLDATNIIRPSACLLTPVDLEHTDILGDTIERIAKEKSGIIKPGIPVFSGFQVPEVKSILKEVSDSQKSPISFLDEEIEKFSVDLSPEGTIFVLKLKGMEERKFTLKLLGEFQAENAALAYLVIRNIFPHVSDGIITKGIEKAFLPGRMELIQTNPPVILDGAHTPLAGKRLWSSFSKIFPAKGILIFGAISGKKIEEMARILAPGFREIIISTPGYFKESNPDEVFSVFKQLNSYTILEKDPSEALQKALKASHNELPILVTGSFFMVSEIRKFFLNFNMEKAIMRKKIQTILRKLTPEDIRKRSSIISGRLFQTDWWNKAQIILAFCSMEGEVDTREIIQTAIDEAKMVVVPRVQDRDLIFHQIRDLEDDKDFTVSHWGIKEPCDFLPMLNPAEILPQTCLIITPGLAFDKHKHRLGRGGGFYDRFLCRVRQCDSLTIFAIGVCFSEQLLEQVPIGDHDCPVDGVVTEQEIIY